jgi:sigma-B regulation protein RsbU (phosphoserine phosphatase)
LTKLFLKYRANIVIFFTILLIAVALLNIYYTLEVNVASNDECLWRPEKSVMSIDEEVNLFFSNVKKDGVAWKAGIRNGDQLLEINNIKIKTAYQAQMILNSFNSGEPAPYTVKKPDGEILETTVYVKKLVEYGILAASISALIYLLIGFIVLSAKPDGLSQRLFYALGVLSVFTAMQALVPRFGGMQQLFEQSQILGTLIGSLMIIGNSFVPIVLLAFVWTFPKPFHFIEKTWVKLLLILIPLLMSVTGNIIGHLSLNARIISLSYFIQYRSVIGIIVALTMIAAIISMFFQFWRVRKTTNRKPVLIFLISMIFGFIVGIYVNNIAPAITDTIYNSPEYYMPVVLLVLVPLGFAYAIFKYQLLDVGEVLKNAIIYGTATLGIAAIYFFVIYVIGQSISTALGTDQQGIIAGIFFIVFALIFQSTKDRFQDFLTKRFYPEQFAHQKILMKFSSDIPTIVGLDNVLDITQQTFVEALQLKKFGILIRDNKSGQLNLVKSFGISKTECRITNSSLTQFIRDKNSTNDIPVIQQNDFERIFPDNFRQMIDEGFYTAVPMYVKSKVVGLLLFGLKYSGSQFAGKDLELLSAAANQIAISIENARLYETESEKLKLERDLELARQIQQSLLPRCIPAIHGLDICGEMIPAMQVGGDYFDLIQVSDTKLFVAVGDVSGKGLPASFYMTKVQTMIQLACNNSVSPRNILVDVNKKMYESMERNWFVTMTLALFDTEKKSVKFCRAGHLPLFKAINGTVHSLKTGGIGLGLEKGPIFEQTLIEEEMKLNSGEIYAFFSDGITEAMNEKNDMFGEESLKELLIKKSNYRSSQIMNEIWTSIKSFRGSTEVNDDMTMVIVKVS